MIPSGLWYQEAVIDGVMMPTIRHNDTSEKRWNELIKPLVKLSHGLAIELGSNAGFYLRKLADMGFTTIGIEKSDEYIAHARYWEEKDPKGVATLQMDINDYDIPLSHLVLLANIHYWLKAEDIVKLVEKLRKKTLHVIVVGRNVSSPTAVSPPDLTTLRTYFHGWIQDEKKSNGKHYSVLFRNPDLIELDTDEVLKRQPVMRTRSKRFLISFNDFISHVLSGEKFNTGKSLYFRYLKQRLITNARELVKKRSMMIWDVYLNGLQEPLVRGRVVGGEYIRDRLSDGDHRLILAKYLGIKKIICKQI